MAENHCAFARIEALIPRREAIGSRLRRPRIPIFRLGAPEHAHPREHRYVGWRLASIAQSGLHRVGIFLGIFDGPRWKKARVHEDVVIRSMQDRLHAQPIDKLGTLETGVQCVKPLGFAVTIGAADQVYVVIAENDGAAMFARPLQHLK